MWTLTNQWDVEHTTENNTGSFLDVPAIVSLYFAKDGEPIWATTQISSIQIHDDEEDYAAIFFRNYLEHDGSGVRTVDVHMPENKFKKRVEIGSERMVALTYQADWRKIYARGVISIKFWKKS
jgi:hypothetical protein